MVTFLVIWLVAAGAALLLLISLLAVVLLSPSPPPDGRPMPWESVPFNMWMRIGWWSEVHSSNAMVCTVRGAALEMFVCLPEPDPGATLPVGTVFYKGGTKDKPRLVVVTASDRIPA